MKKNDNRKTTVGVISPEVLAFTAGKDVVLDLALVQADCMGSAAHATMLSRMPVKPRLFSKTELDAVLGGLADIMRTAAAGKFTITIEDQDVHLAVERTLTEKLGDLGKRIHTGRSRNDQVALDLRLYGKEQLLATMEEATALADVLLDFAKRHEKLPMVGRTHMQTAMPSSVGLWASSFAESLTDDLVLLRAAYELNNRSPLGSAASYGVPLPIDRALVARLLGFAGTCHNVLHANNSRGKMESIILAAMSQVMLTLSRLAQDLMLFTMPEFGYFTLPAAFTTGSSIMPQKKNPDVCELMRARASKVEACALAVFNLVKGSPTGYNRDLQDAKEFFMEGVAVTRACLRIAAPMIAGMQANREALLRGFTPDVFATDRALELVGQGMPFRDAYHHVKAHIEELQACNPFDAIAKKTHEGATAGLDFARMREGIRSAHRFARTERAAFDKAIRRLMGNFGQTA